MDTVDCKKYKVKKMERNIQEKSNNVLPNGFCHCLRTGIHMKLIVNFLDMGMNRMNTDEAIFSNHFITITFYQGGQYFLFPGGQWLIIRLHLDKLLLKKFNYFSGDGWRHG